MEAGKVLTADEARERITRMGIPIAVWARRNGLRTPAVYDLLLGRRFGNHGDGHKAAVLLGMKEGTLDETPESGRSAA